MTLTTHAVTGAAIASVVSGNIVIASTLAFASHFLLDAIPHWDYPISSGSINPKIGGKINFDKSLLKDLFRIGSDILFGILLSLIIFYSKEHVLTIAVGAFFGMLPDFLQFVYTRFPKGPIASLQRFHEFIHTDKKLKNQPILGVTSQIAIIIVISILAKNFV